MRLNIDEQTRKAIVKAKSLEYATYILTTTSSLAVTEQQAMGIALDIRAGIDR